jgi:hypothetical protein
MKRAASQMRNLLVCAAFATAVLGCAADTPQITESSQGAICTVRSSGDPWWLATFPEQTGRFHVLVQATPNDNNIDAVIGVSQAPATTWSQLAAIVRFAPSGLIDVRNGGTYTANRSYAYTAGTTYFIRVEIDVIAKTYDVHVKTTANGDYTTIAYGYAFRTEQQNVASLAAAAVYLDTTAPGSLQICDLEAIRDDSTPDGCITSGPGNGFSNAWMEPETGAMVSRFVATPSANAMDGVVGYSVGPADGFSDLAAAVRFYTNGQIEARDGDVYRATNPFAYVAGRAYQFHVVLDFVTARYSVYVGSAENASTYTVIADNFRFRTQQAGIEMINNVASIVDSGAGEVRTCRMNVDSTPELRHLRAGSYKLAPFRDGRVVIASGGQGQILDNTGRTVATGPLADDIRHMGVDASGNIYTATVDPPAAVLTISSVTSSFAPRWSRTYPVDGSPTAFGVYDNGQIGVALAGPGVRIASVMTLDANGNELSRVDVTANTVISVGFGRDRYAIGYTTGDFIGVEVRAIDSTPLWERTWAGMAWPYETVVEPSGSVVFGGSFGGDGIDFGTGHFEAYSHPEANINGYIVALSETGALRFANRLFADAPTSLASSGDRIVYVTTLWTQMPHMQMWIYGRDGTEYHGGDVHLSEETMGSMGDTIVDSEGRVIANAGLKLHPSNAVPFWRILATLVY